MSDRAARGRRANGATYAVPVSECEAVPRGFRRECADSRRRAGEGRVHGWRSWGRLGGVGLAESQARVRDTRLPPNRASELNHNSAQHLPRPSARRSTGLHLPTTSHPLKTMSDAKETDIKHMFETEEARFIVPEYSVKQSVSLALSVEVSPTGCSSLTQRYCLSYPRLIKDC